MPAQPLSPLAGKTTVYLTVRYTLISTGLEVGVVSASDSTQVRLGGDWDPVGFNCVPVQ